MTKFYKTFIILLNISVLSFSSLKGQEHRNVLKLRTGNITVEEGIADEVTHPGKEEIFQRKYYRIIQFREIPSTEQKAELKQAGVRLLDYLPHMAFFAEIDESYAWNGQEKDMFRSVLKVNDQVKLHPDLYAGKFPEWAMSGNEIMINVVFFADLSFDLIIADLIDDRVELLEKKEVQHKITLLVKPKLLSQLAAKPYVYFVEPIDEPAEPENYTGRTLHRSNAIANDMVSGRKYDGTGINMGMHDDGIIGPHIDYEGRIPIQYPGSNNGDHGDHVAGTIMGAGNLNPIHQGMAFGANLYVYGSSNNNYDSVPSHYTNYDVVITSKSYSNGCNAGYTSLSRELDQYVRLHPSLMHVFSAGNDGNSDCGYGAGSGWGNITGGHKAGKNVITVANLNRIDQLAGSSSRGPAEDGRIKPDVSAKGTSVVSTTDVNDYTTKSGTSMSCPGVSGSLAQLYHAYRDLNGGAYPPSALMKSVMMNSADDIGNPGPDFKHGYGRINNLRAVEILENNQYHINVIDQNDSLTHSIPVPAGVSQLKVMVYWNDHEASSGASIALVNNIDFTLTDPSMAVFNPWVLDHTPTPAALNANAVRGVDNLNNMEQVTIDNPAAGTYTATIRGKVIPQGPQQYVVVYSYVMDEVKVTYPNGGEPLVPFETEFIRWDSPKTASNFTIEYSTDNGASWNLVSTVSNTVRYYTWTVPNILTGRARIRVSSGANSDISDTSFSIMTVPTNLDVEWSCPDSVKFRWTVVNNAIEYEVSMLGNKYMDSVGRTTANSIVLHGIQPNETKWLSVKALGPNGAIGRRAIAIEKPLGTFDCPIKDDIAVSSIIAPGSAIPDCKDHAATSVSVVIKNEGTNTVSNIPVNYRVGAGSVVTEVNSATIAPGDSVAHTFAATADLSNPLRYEIVSWTSLASDKNEYNDSASTQVESYSSNVVQLPWSEDFEDFFLCGIFNNCGNTDCDLTNGWKNLTNYEVDDHDWRTDNDGTRTNGSGPDIDHNPGTTSGKYLYTEASAGCNFMEAVMVTPCIDLTNAKEPELTFWHHMYGFDMGELHVDVLYKDEWVRDVITYNGNRGDQWRESNVDLSAFIGDTINIGFRGITGPGPYSDMAVDDISVIETSQSIGITDNHEKQAEFYVFPNPADGKISLMCRNVKERDWTLTVTDISGRAVYTGTLVNEKPDRSVSIDLSTLEGGVYLIRLETGADIFTRKIVLK